MCESNKRFSEMLKVLKSKGIKQIDIINKISEDFLCNETVFSHLKSGKIKNIPNDLIKALHKHYNINPNYLLLKSDSLFDTSEIKLEHFENFVDDWNIVESGEDKYLHLTLDRNFYDFLLNWFRVKEIITSEGISSHEQEKDTLKELYHSTPSPEEFVLIPRNNFIEIVSDDVKNYKQLSEVLDLLDYKSYLAAVPQTHISHKSKKEILDRIRKEILEEEDNSATV